MIEVSDPILDALALRKSSLATLIVQTLEKRILTGQIKAGERLNEIALAEEFGVSRGPIREAARLLERSNLVMSIANRGSFVREVDLNDVLELYDLRASLTLLACGVAAERKTTKLLAQIDRLIDEMHDASELDDQTAYYDLNLAFHDLLVAMTGNHRLKQTYDGLVKEAHLFRQASLSHHQDMTASNSEHAVIAAAIREGNVSAARQAGFDHVIAGKQRLLAEVNSEPSDRTKIIKTGGNQT